MRRFCLGHGAAAATGTDNRYIGGNGNETSSGVGATVSVAYTCASTANHLKVFVGGQGSSLSLSEHRRTGGRSHQFKGGLNHPGQNDNAKYWIMGCASGANTITGTAGSGGTPSQIIHVSEYSGITMNGDGAVVYTRAGSGTSCSVSATSSQVGDLAIVDYLWSNANSNLYMRSTGSQQRMWIGVGGPQYGNGGGGAYYVSTDNLVRPEGAR